MAGEHYCDGILPQVPGRLDDAQYAQVLDHVVLACCDLLVLDPAGRVLIGLRSREPWPSWWVFGGRMRRGQSFQQAARAKAREELGVDIDEDRFAFVTSYSTAFERRAQEPAGNGVHTVNAVMRVQLLAGEVSDLEPNDEYRQARWVTPQQIGADRSLHPLLRQLMRDAHLA